jgi:hypothetical protein
LKKKPDGTEYTDAKVFAKSGTMIMELKKEIEAETGHKITEREEPEFSDQQINGTDVHCNTYMNKLALTSTDIYAYMYTP